ncbi:hypothetical protein [Shewanella inventionis]|jgi:hypothetical protein|uniref:Phytanoyl-CoA dioxygenase n=1 Tax=Shewanella inventionis TaxID=1738770 RepID=A0ABQ1JX57_9GAMM|nr:hypothetical protein [Shewanella inventionis]MCL1160151.1 hypothetical protein [Shewanella inventionis]GGB76763.1 hypothetical protein GCM10011607_41260 [Shewanella inventionis]
MIINKKIEFKTKGITKISFSNEALSPCRQIYYNLRNSNFEPTDDIGIKHHDDSVKSDNEIKMRWFFAKSEAAIKLFRDVLDGCELSLSRSLTDVPYENMRVVQANIIEVRGSYPVGRWHSDMVDEKLSKNQSITLLTPLFTLENHIGGLETTSTPRNMFNYEENSIRHKYKDGEAIAFDGTATVHRTEKYEASDGDIRLLMCWQLADSSEEMIESLYRIGTRNGDPMFVGKHI